MSQPKLVLVMFNPAILDPRAQRFIKEGAVLQIDDPHLETATIAKSRLGMPGPTDAAGIVSSVQQVCQHYRELGKLG